MQLGTRWNVGDAPPAKLADAVLAAIADVESQLAGVDAVGWRWTLTWLEGRPVVELDTSTSSVQATGTVIRLGHDGVVTVEQTD